MVFAGKRWGQGKGGGGRSGEGSTYVWDRWHSYEKQPSFHPCPPLQPPPRRPSRSGREASPALRWRTWARTTCCRTGSCARSGGGSGGTGPLHVEGEGVRFGSSHEADPSVPTNSMPSLAAARLLQEEILPYERERVVVDLLGRVPGVATRGRTGGQGARFRPKKRFDAPRRLATMIFGSFSQF
jgi:hypothetical protein